MFSINARKAQFFLKKSQKPASEFLQSVISEITKKTGFIREL